MIEHADAALESWLGTLDPPVDVTFERDPDGAGKKGRPTVQLALTNIREQVDKRDNQIDDVRAGGRVVARQKATRFFEVDYTCTITGPAREAHRALGDLLQLLVDHDVVPDRHVPDELQNLGYPLDVRLVNSSLPTAAVTLQIVMPVQPTPEREVGPPTTSLHLDMAPPPKKRGVQPAPEPVPEYDLPPLSERKWTTVRRRELIGKTHTVTERKG